MKNHRLTRKVAKSIVSICLSLLIFAPFNFPTHGFGQGSITSGFEPEDSPYLQNPELAIGFVDSSANFWRSVYDNQLGGFYSDVDKAGNATGNTKHMISQSRNAYAFVRAYMLTGKTEHLEMAEAALDFMYEHAWDETYGGWYGNLDASGNPVNANAGKSAFDQHYALLGITAFYEATRDSTAWNWLMKGYNHLENVYWDSRSGFEGYYDVTDFDASNARHKSFNATVDAITTHLLYLYLMTEDESYLTRLQELAEEISDHLVASMPGQVIGFVEKYDSDWNWDNSQTLTIMGHVLKTGWCLGRIYQIDPDPSYLTDANILMFDVWQNGYDHEFGGPYKDYNRVTGEMLLWGLSDTTKAWWQMEQAVTGGLQLFEITGDSTYWRMADESLDFLMTFFVDRDHGEVYADRTRYGDFAWNENKGSQWKAGYHSSEMGYYVYLYGNLLLNRGPATLHYNFDEAVEERALPMTPLAIDDSKLFISEILWDGQPYANYSGRTVTLPAGVGGHFEVTYAQIITAVAAQEALPEIFELSQNYPNPFNPTTTIRYNLPEASHTVLKVYNVLGQEIRTLSDEPYLPGEHSITWDGKDSSGRAVASGIYLYRLQAGDPSTGSGQSFSQVRKMTLLR